MTILENVPLAPYTTFKIGGNARFFCSIKDEAGLRDAVEFARKQGLPLFVLGGGSNVLISDKGFPGLVIKMELKGMTLEGESLTVFAGENWDDAVAYAVARGLHGLENLSLIPGTVGAAPIQNIGAYGGEAAETIESVRVLDTKTMQFADFSNADCRLGYRDSIFKHEKGRYIIISVKFRLVKNGQLNFDYKDVKDWYVANPSHPKTLAGLREAVIAIRTAKLPDFSKIGTAGSFFKNPVISKEHFDKLKKEHPDLPGFPEPDGRVKVSLAWIIDKVCGLKGFKIGNVGTHERQALVIVASKGASADEVDALAVEIARQVKEKMGIDIDREVERVG